jgi:nucleoside-diphosphate-sugar epimerase
VVKGSAGHFCGKYGSSADRAGGPSVAMREIRSIIRDHLGEAARHVPTRSIPSFVVRVAALFSPELRAAVPDLGYVKRLSSDHSRTVLGWQPRPAEEAIVAAAESMVRKGLVRS